MNSTHVFQSNDGRAGISLFLTHLNGGKPQKWNGGGININNEVVILWGTKLGQATDTNVRRTGLQIRNRRSQPCFLPSESLAKKRRGSVGSAECTFFLTRV